MLAKSLAAQLVKPGWHGVSDLPKALKQQGTLCLVLAQIYNEYQEAIANSLPIEWDQNR